MAGIRCTYAVCNHYFKVLQVEHTYIFGISGGAVVSTGMITCPSSCPVQYVLLPAAGCAQPDNSPALIIGAFSSQGQQRRVLITPAAVITTQPGPVRLDEADVRVPPSSSQTRSMSAA